MRAEGEIIRGRVFIPPFEIGDKMRLRPDILRKKPRAPAGMRHDDIRRITPIPCGDKASGGGLAHDDSLFEIRGIGVNPFRQFPMGLVADEFPVIGRASCPGGGIAHAMAAISQPLPEGPELGREIIVNKKDFHKLLRLAR